MDKCALLTNCIGRFDAKPSREGAEEIRQILRSFSRDLEQMEQNESKEPQNNSAASSLSSSTPQKPEENIKPKKEPYEETKLNKGIEMLTHRGQLRAWDGNHGFLAQHFGSDTLLTNVSAQWIDNPCLHMRAMAENIATTSVLSVDMIIDRKACYHGWSPFTEYGISEVFCVECNADTTFSPEACIMNNRKFNLTGGKDGEPFPLDQVHTSYCIHCRDTSGSHPPSCVRVNHKLQVQKS